MAAIAALDRMSGDDTIGAEIVEREPSSLGKLFRQIRRDDETFFRERDRRSHQFAPRSQAEPSVRLGESGHGARDADGQAASQAEPGNWVAILI